MEQRPDHIPKGYGIVRYGKLRADDLVWDWCGKVWRRHDFPDWDQLPVENAADVVCAVRAGLLRRKSNRQEILDSSIPVTTPTKGQASLF